MNRRDLLRSLATAIAIPAISELEPDTMLAVGRRAHRRAGTGGLQVLDPHQSETVATIAEMIIPATDTPGARAAEVHRFIDLLLAEWAPDDDRKQFLEGLADVDARARAASARDFLSATEAQRGTILTALDAEAQERRKAKGDAPPAFVERMKFLTVYGYCTSEVGATAELHYEAIPGSYSGCTELGRWRASPGDARQRRSEEHTSELQSPCNLVCRLLLEKKKKDVQFIYHVDTSHATSVHHAA